MLHVSVLSSVHGTEQARTETQKLLCVSVAELSCALLSAKTRVSTCLLASASP